MTQRKSERIVALTGELIDFADDRRVVFGGRHGTHRAVAGFEDYDRDHERGGEAEGAPLLNRKLRRAEVLRFFGKLLPCLVGMEACASSHYRAREIAAFGHDAKLLPPQYVKPFLK